MPRYFRYRAHARAEDEKDGESTRPDTHDGLNSVLQAQ